MLTPPATLPSGIVFNADKEFSHVVNLACALASSGLYLKPNKIKGAAPTMITNTPGDDGAVCGVAIVDHALKIYLSLKVDFENHINMIQVVIGEGADKHRSETSNN